MEGIFGGQPTPPTTQGQEDAFGLETAESPQIQQTVQPGVQVQNQVPTQRPQSSAEPMPQSEPVQQMLPAPQRQNQLQTQQSEQQIPIPQTRDQILSEMMRIGQQIGKRIDLEKVNAMSDYDLQQQYFEALKDLQQSEQPEEAQQQQPSSELKRLQKQNQEMGKLLTQLMGANQQQAVSQYPQPRQQMTQLPGQYLQPQYGQSQQFQQIHNQQQQSQLPQINSEEFYSRLEENPSGAIAEITTPLVEKALAQQAQQFQSYLQQTREQQQREQQIQQFYSQQIDYLKQTHPDFDQYRHVAAQVLNERPHYAMMENGLVYAYEEAKQRVQSYNQQQFQHQQPVNQQQTIQKQVAGVPGTVNYFQKPRSENPFGSVIRKGIFG